MINMHTKFEVSSLSRSRDILGGTKNLKWVKWRPRPVQGQFVVHRLGLAMINMYTKFEASSLSHSRDILRGLKV